MADLHVKTRVLGHILTLAQLWSRGEWGGGEGTWVDFCWVMPLASQSPYHIIVYIVWPTIDPILVSFGQM